MEAGESAFWQFSLRFYRRPEVPTLCIALQDHHGVDVNLLFFMMFLGLHGRQVTAADVRRADACIGDWRQRVVQPLRTLRRDLKGGMAHFDPQATEALRSAIKRDELQAERLQQEALERQFPLHDTGVAAAPRLAAGANIAAYAATAGELPDGPVNTLLTALFEEFPG